jgi:HK97 family phage major capsid protein
MNLQDKLNAHMVAKASLSPSESKQFDAYMAEADALKAQIDRAEHLGELDSELSALAPRSRAARESLYSDAPRETWKNTRTGEAIRVLNKGEKLTDVHRPDVRSNITLGDYAAALVSPNAITDLGIRNVLQESSSPSGGYLVPESLAAEVVDAMRAKSVIFNAGARLVEMNAPNMRIARLDTDPTGSWRVENSPITEDAPTFSAVNVSARTYGVIVRASRELFEDVSNLGEMLTNSLAAAFALAIDRATLTGSGAAEEPMGLANLDDVASIELGSGDGGYLSGYDDILKGRYNLLNANSAEPSAAIMSPRTEWVFSAMKDGEGVPMPRTPAIASLPFLVTTTVSDTETTGINSDTSSIYLGDYKQLIVANKTSFTLNVLRERYAADGQVGFVGWMRSDIAVLRPQAFCRISGIRLPNSMA